MGLTEQKFCQNLLSGSGKYSFRQKWLSLSLLTSMSSLASIPSAMANFGQPVNLPVTPHPINWSHTFNSHAGGASASNAALFGHTASLQGTPLHGLLTSASGGATLDLTSIVPIFAAGSIAGFHQISIDIGGNEQIVTVGSKLTGAELVAAQQVLAGGKQSIVIDSQGAADGGSFSLNNRDIGLIDNALGGAIKSLDIPQNVQLIDTLSSLSLQGTLNNAGIIDVGAATGARNQTIDVISAANINNSAGALIASGSAATGITSLAPTAISLVATGGITNAGTLISNNSVSISAPTVNNSGLVESIDRNVNISSGNAAANLTVNGAGGTVQAVNGNINFGQKGSGNSGDISVSGGNYISQQANFNAGTGAINVNVGQLTGTVNGTAGDSHVAADTSDLILGNISVSADPSFYNPSGDVTIGGNVSSTNGADLTIIAGGNIIGDGGKLTTSASSGGGDLTLIAGANVALTESGSTLTIATNQGSSASATGGYIDLSGVTLTGATTNKPVTTITTASSAGPAGDVLMVAYQGSLLNSGSVVVQGAKSAAPINAAGALASGSVTIIGNGSKIEVGNITDNTGTLLGVVNILGTTPTVVGGTLTADVNSGVVNGGYSTSPTSYSYTAISIGSINTSLLAGSQVYIETAGTLSQAKGTSIISQLVDITASGNIGSSASPFLTNTSTLTLYQPTVTSSNSVFLKDTNTTSFELNDVSITAGGTISVTSAAAKVDIDNLPFANVNIVGTNKDGSAITLDASDSAGYQVGAGGGNVAIAGRSIVSGTASNVITGNNVTLTASDGDIDASSPAASSNLVLSALTLTANAAKGQAGVLITDSLPVILNAGKSLSSYNVSAPDISVNGAISGSAITLDATTGLVAIDANLGAAGAGGITVDGYAGIAQTSAKAVLTGQSINLNSSDGAIGSTTQGVKIANGATLTLGPSVFGNTYVSAVQNLVLGNGSSTAGNLTVTAVGSIALTGNNSFGNISISAPEVVVQSAAALSATNTLAINTAAMHVANDATVGAAEIDFTSSGKLQISGDQGMVGAIAPTTSLSITAKSDITLGLAGLSLDPLQGALSSGVLGSVVISTGGKFNIDTNEISAVNTLSISASGIFNIGTNPLSDLQLTTSASGAHLTLQISGAQTLNLSSVLVAKDANLALSNSGGSGYISVAAKGALNDGSGGVTSTSLNQLSLSGSSIAMSESEAASSIAITTPSLTVNSGGSIDASTALIISAPVTANSVTAQTSALSVFVNGTGAIDNGSAATTSFISTGAISISGAGTINPGSALVLEGTTYVANYSSVTNPAGSITLGVKGGGSNPLAKVLAGTAGDLFDFTADSKGVFTIPASGINLVSTANGGNIFITAGSVLVVGAGNAAVSLNANAADNDLAGLIKVTVTGNQALTLGTGPGDFNFSAAAAGTDGGGNISVSTAGSLIVNSGGIVLSSVAGSSTLTLAGDKSLLINDPNLPTSGALGELSLTSGAKSAFNIGDPASGTLSNGVIGGLGSSNLIGLTLNVGGGIVLNGANNVTLAATGSMLLLGSGILSITDAPSGSGTIALGENLSIISTGGITLGDPKTGLLSPFGLGNIFDGSSLATLFLETKGVITSPYNSFSVNSAAEFGKVLISANNLVQSGTNTGAPFSLTADGEYAQVLLFINGPQAVTLGSDTVTGKNPQQFEISTTGLLGTVNVVTIGALTAATGGIIGGLDQQLMLQSSAGSLTINTGGVSIGTEATITFESAKNLSVIDPNLFSAANSLGYVTLSSGSSSVFTIGATGSSLVNGIAGSGITAGTIMITDNAGITINNNSSLSATAEAFQNYGATVTLTTSKFTNNGTISGDGDNEGALFSLGAAGNAALTVVEAGTINQFAGVVISANGNINLGDFFSSENNFGGGTPTGALIGLYSGGTITFGPTVMGLAVGPTLTNDGNPNSGGSINVQAKSLVFQNTSSPFTFDASQSKNGMAGRVSIDTTAPITLGSGKGNIAVNVGTPVEYGELDLDSSGAVTVNTVGGISFGDGSIIGKSVVFNTGVNAFPGGRLTVTATGPGAAGAITTASAALLDVPTLILTQNQTKLSSPAINIDSTSLTLITGAFNIINTTTSNSFVQGGNTVAALNYVDTQAKSTSVGSLSTTNGGITIITPSKLSVYADSTLSTKSGSITLEAVNKTSGVIDIGADATIYASGTVPGVGQVNLTIGALPLISSLSRLPIPSPAPPEIQVGGGIIYFGLSNGLGTLTADNTSSLNALGRDIIINPANSSSGITLGAGDSITADPPSGGSVAAGVVAAQALSAPTAISAGIISTVSSPIQPLAQLLNVSSSALSSNLNQANWGLLPLVSTASTVERFVQPLRGGLSNVVVKTLERGVKLVSPLQDTVYATDFGNVSVAARAAAIIMSFDSGLAVYNLHDQKSGAVSLALGSRTIKLSPGQHVLITSANVRCFEEINPAQGVGYRRMVGENMDNGLKTFRSDFNVLSMLRSLGSLKETFDGQNVAARKTFDAIIKTSAILNQIDQTPFEPMRLPSITALAERH